MTRTHMFTSFAAVLLTAGVAFAQCDGSKTVAAADGKKCCSAEKKDCASKCPSASICTTEVAGVTVPAMSFKVGDKAIACPEEAKKLAEANHTQLVYVVADKEYSCENSAKQAYAAQLATYMDEMMTVKFAVGDDCVACPMTAQQMASKAGKKVMYRVAKFDYPSMEAANTAVEHAKEAVQTVSMKWKVGEKTYCCDKMAGEAAQKEHKQVEFCVGEKTTACKDTASVELARAKIEAAVTALAKDAQS